MAIAPLQGMTPLSIGCLIKRCLLGLVALLVPVAASGQDVGGAGRVEIGSAIFGGGMLVTPSPTPAETASRSYMVGAALTVNLTKWIGLEGDVGLALGRSESLALYGVAPSDRRTPNVLIYGGSLIYNPFRSDRSIVPYVSAGAGALTVFGGPEAANFGLAADTTYLTASAGGGVRWFPISHWGLRADYCVSGVKNDIEAAQPGRRVVRSVQRVYGALIMTF